MKNHKFLSKKILYKILDIDLLVYSTIFLLFGLGISLIAYYSHIPMLNSISFYAILISLIILFFQMGKDLRDETNSLVLTFIFIISILLLYFYQRTELHRFDFFIADASDYYLAGVNSIIRGGDMGFFLPLTSSISAVGFTFGGYELGPFIMVIIYSSAIPLIYFLFRSLHLNALLSYMMVLFIISTPLSIWFSKSTYSEPIWQIQILLLTTLSYIILGKEHIKTKEFISFYLLMIIIPFTRGEASLLYGVIIFLSLYHLWKYNNLKMVLLIALGSLFLAFSIHYTLGLRSHYLLKWQYARIIPEITEVKLMTLLYSVSFFIFGFLILLQKVQRYFSKLNIFFIITGISILIKIVIAYVYYLKKGAIVNTLLFKNALGFNNFLILNELGFAYDSFGLLITVLVCIGLIILYIKAFKGDVTALFLVVLYTIFTLPFVMQVVNTNDIHEIFLYWGRYYFSVIMIIHIFSSGLVIQLVYHFIKKIVQSIIYGYILLLIFITITLYVSMDSKLYRIVTNESYLQNSQKLMPWIKAHTGKQSLSIVYDENIKYELHHNRVYDAKILTYRTFPVAKINVQSYQKVNLDKSLHLNSETMRNKFLLCLSKKPYQLNKNKFKKIDSIILPISWREHYGIHTKDKRIHQGKLTQSIKHNIQLYATLYKIPPQEINNTFAYSKEIIFNKSSKLSTEILKNNWYYTNNDKGAWALTPKTILTIPHIKKERHIKYSIVLKYFIFDVLREHPKNIKISLNNKTLKEIIVYNSSMRFSTIHIPNNLLSKNKKDIVLHIEIMEDSIMKDKSPYSIYLESLKIIKSKE